MLLSDSDRERLFGLLTRHAAAGRLTVEELELRVGLVAQATTREDVTAALADLPPLAAEPAAPGHMRRRGHGETDQPAPDWTPTAERFRDPRSNRIMRVWVDASGARHYVADG